MKIELLL